MSTSEFNTTSRVPPVALRGQTALTPGAVRDRLKNTLKLMKCHFFHFCAGPFPSDVKPNQDLASFKGIDFF
jgi:hypothetical protein